MNYGVCDIGTLSQLIALLPRERNKYYNISRIPSVIKPYIPPSCGCTKDVVSLKQKCKFVYNELTEGDLIIPVLGLDVTIRSLEIFMKPSHVLHIENTNGLIKTLVPCGEMLENGVKIYHYISSTGDRLALYIHKDVYFRVKDCSFTLPMNSLAFTSGFYEILDETNNVEANMKIPQENYVKLISAAQKRSNHLLSIYIDNLQKAIDEDIAEANTKNEQVKTELKVLRESVVDIKNKLQKDIGQVEEKVEELELKFESGEDIKLVEITDYNDMELVVINPLKPDFDGRYPGKVGPLIWMFNKEIHNMKSVIEQFINNVPTYILITPSSEERLVYKLGKYNGVGELSDTTEQVIIAEYVDKKGNMSICKISTSAIYFDMTATYNVYEDDYTPTVKLCKCDQSSTEPVYTIPISEHRLIEESVSVMNTTERVNIRNELNDMRNEMGQLELKSESAEEGYSLYLQERNDFGQMDIRDNGIYPPAFETKADGSKVCTKPGKFHEFAIKFTERDASFMNKYFTNDIPVIMNISLNEFDKYTYMYCGMSSNENDGCYFVNTDGVYAKAYFNQSMKIFEFVNSEKIPFEHEADAIDVKFYRLLEDESGSDLTIPAEVHAVLKKYASKKDLEDKLYTQNYIRKNSIENVWNYKDTISEFYASNSIRNMNASVKTEGSITYVTVPNTIKAVSTPGTKVGLSFKKDDTDYVYNFMILSIEHTSDNSFTIYTLFDNVNNPTSISSNVNIKVSYDTNTRMYTYEFPSELVFDENTHFSTYSATALQNSYHSSLSGKNPRFDQLIYRNLSDNSKNERTIMDEIYGLKHIYTVIPEALGKVQGILMEDGFMYEKEGDVVVKPGNITVLTGRFANISSYADMETAVIKNTPGFMKLKINNVDPIHYFKYIGMKAYNRNWGIQIPYYVSDRGVGIFVQPQEGTTNSFNIYIDQYRKPLEFTSASSLEMKFLNRTDNQAGILSADKANIEVIPRNIYDELIRKEIYELRNDSPVDIRTIVKSESILTLNVSDAIDDGSYKVWNNLRFDQTLEKFHPGSWCYMVTTDNEIIPYMYAYYKDTDTERQHILVSYNKPITKLTLGSNGLYERNIDSFNILKRIIEICKMKELHFTLNFQYEYTFSDSPIGALFTNAHRAVAERLYLLDKCLNWSSGTYYDGKNIASYDLTDSSVCNYNSSSKQYTIQSTLSIDSFDMPGCIYLYAGSSWEHLAECHCIKMIMENDVYALTCMTTHPEIPEVVFRLNESNKTLIVDGSNLTKFTLTKIEIYNENEPYNYGRTQKLIGGFGTTIMYLMKQVKELKAEVAALKSGA